MQPTNKQNPHYKNTDIEAIDVIEDWCLDFNLGNVIKYVARCDFKGNRLKDLEKALYYLDREIKFEKKLLGKE